MAVAETSFAVSVVLLLKDQLSGKVGKSLSGVNKHIKSLTKGAAIASGLSLATRGISQAASGMIGSLAGAAGELDDSMAKVRSMPGLAEEAAQRISVASKAWTKEHVASAAQFADTSYDMLSAGLESAAAIAGTRTAMLTATATMGDHREAAQLLATMYNNVGDQSADVGEEMTRLGDIVTRTQQTFQFENLGQLTEGMRYATVPMISFRMNLEEVTAAIGQLNNAGLQGSMAGTAFQASMDKMVKASSKLGFEIAKNADGGRDLIGTLKNLRDKYGDLSELTTAQQLDFQKAFGGPEALRAITLLSANLDDLEKNYEAVKDSAGAAAAGAAKIEQSAGAQWKIFLNNMQAVRMEIGAAILPALKSMAGPIREIASGIASFASEHPGVVKIGVALIGLTAAVSPVLAVVGAVGLLAAGVAAISAPVLIVVAGIAALAAGAALIYANWGGISEWFTAQWAEVTAVFTRIRENIGPELDALGASIKERLGGAFRGAVDMAKQKWGELMAWFQGMPAEFTAIGANIVAGIKQGILNAWGSFKGWFKGLFSGLPGMAKAELKEKSPSQVFAEIGQNVMAGMRQGLERGRGQVEGAMGQMVGNLKKAAAGMALGAGVSMAPMVEAMQSLGAPAQQAGAASAAKAAGSGSGWNIIPTGAKKLSEPSASKGAPGAQGGGAGGWQIIPGQTVSTGGPGAQGGYQPLQAGPGAESAARGPVTVSPTINISAAAGMDESRIARIAVQEMERSVRHSKLSRRGRLFD